MRPKRKNVCQDCRSRKLACDGAQPSCSQCVHRHISCSGYKQDFVFVPTTASKDSKKVTTVKEDMTVESTPLLSTSPIATQSHVVEQHNHSAPLINAARQEATMAVGSLESPESYRDLQDNILFIVQHYAPTATNTPEEAILSHNQICGAWVNVLPLIAQSRTIGQPLVSAIETLATALRHHDVIGGLFQPQILELYCNSLGHVAKALAEAQGIFRVEHCAAIMRLAVADVVTPGLKSGWMTHARGVGDMMQALGPMPFSVGMMHSMFIGFRPLLLMSSIINRRGLFLAREEWITLPFHGQPVSMMQRILNIVCILPSLLERYDTLVALSETSNLGEVERLWIDCHAFLTNLRIWERSSQSQAIGPLVWSTPDHGSRSFSNASALWFPNMLVANSLTHYWAFEIIIRLHLNTLEQMIDTTKGCELQSCLPNCDEGLGEKPLVELAEMICDSIPFLLQPEMKLHGLGSAFFILPTALRVLRSAPDPTAERLARCQQMSELLASNGVEFPYE
ncbi:hypothetical protein T440DRAFT_449340 [Plenodomus tracheiphilus IPT5]|uniref:Zn(2)-C6 fungal-type domain-containing protein n=1 Tax=Plenodomus tracheiphilus IPT5 TaxID=1408161 RepID=A0A6A7B7T1_9PLEO|nr:hypothetical protein T440DRAFT_449340 [Plenodomus tracheiphilus IPT5]